MKSAAKEIRPSIHRLRIFGRVYEREQVIAAAVLMTPVLVAVFMLFILPVVQVVYYSFTNMTTSKRGTFVGIENFKYLIGDSKFFKAIGNTVLFAVMKLVFDTGLALIIALMLDSHIPLRKFLRSTYFAPVVVPVVASSLIWIWFFDPDVGPLNMILEKLGLEPLLWLNDKSTALVSILMFSVWKGIGYNVMLFLTGL